MSSTLVATGCSRGWASPSRASRTPGWPPSRVQDSPSFSSTTSGGLLPGICHAPVSPRGSSWRSRATRPGQCSIATTSFQRRILPTRQPRSKPTGTAKRGWTLNGIVTKTVTVAFLRAQNRSLQQGNKLFGIWLVRMIGLEPTLPRGNWNLNPARLPISPHPHGLSGIITWLRLPQPPQVHRQAVQLVQMIGGRVAGVTNQQKPAGPYFAELLQAHRAPLPYWPAGEIQLLQQVVGGFRGAREGARENFRMRHDDALAAGHGVARQLLPDLQIFAADLRFPRTGFAIHVVGVDAVDHQRASHARVRVGRLQDLPDGAAPGAPAAQHDAAETHTRFVFGLLQQGREPPRIVEQARVVCGTGTGLQRDHRHLVPSGRHFRQPRAAVKEKEDGPAVGGLHSGGQEQRAQREFLAAPGWRLLLQPRVRPRVLYHGRRVLRLLRVRRAQHYRADERQPHGTEISACRPPHCLSPGGYGACRN